MDDLISRQAAIDAVEHTKSAKAPDGEVYVAKINAEMNIQLLPSAQPEPCEDVQHILDYLDNVLHPLVSPEHWNVYSELHDMITALPSAQPERKKGKWSFIGYQMFECTECGTFYTQSQFQQMRVMTTDPDFPRFCPTCGADMREEGGRR